MKTTNTPRGVMKQRLSLLIISAAVIGLGLILFFTFLIGLNTVPKKQASGAVNTTFGSGSYIINMGVTPQWVGNALKPYGLVQELIDIHNIPVHWVINPSKVKDGIDFSYNGTDYRGGPFVIDVNDITPAVSAEIASWTPLGVVGTYTTSSITVPVWGTIRYWPKIIVDDLSGNAPIIKAYFTNAGIDSTEYDIGIPSDATTCYDLWANPHGDPVWATHGPLYNFATYHKGFIWSQCHAVSMLEDVVEPAAPNRQLNYLTTTGLQCWKGTGALGGCGGPPFMEAHAKKATSPFTHYYPADPVMQFMDLAQSALNSNGSEQWFIPLSTGAWRSSTKRYITTSDGTYPGEGVLMVFGPAFGDNNNGKVMYSGGHDHQGGGQFAHQIAAQRSFLNFCLLAGKERAIIQSSSIANTVKGLNWYNFAVTISGGYPPYTINWTSSLGGTFITPDSLTTDFIAPNVAAPTQGTITCTVSDSCGRVMAATQVVTFIPSPLPVTLTEFTASPKGLEKVLCSWVTESEINNDHFTIERSKDGKEYTEVGKVNSKGNGTGTRSYELSDNNPLKGRSYYRLSQTDNNGDVNYFDPVIVNLDKAVFTTNVTAGPNPFTDQITLNLTGISNGTVNALLYDVKGKLLNETEFQASTGSSTFRINNLGILPKGTYILRVKLGEEDTKVFRMMK